MLEYFRQEMFKLKSANYLLRTDLAALRESNQHLTEHNLSLEASHSALKQNVIKISQSNMRLAANHAEQRDAICKLKQELKMEKIRNNSEMKSMQDQLKEKDKLHETELNRMRREMERLRNIIAKTPNKGAPKYERASFNRSNKGVGKELPRVSSMENMSITSTLASSEEEWGHDAFLERTKSPQQKPDNWTVVKKRERHPRKPKPPAGSRRGPRGSSNSNKTPTKYNLQTNKPMPNSSLAAAASKVTPIPSPASSRPPSRAASPAGSRRGSLGRGSSKASLKSPPAHNPPKRTVSQTSLVSNQSSLASSKSKNKPKTIPRAMSQGNIQQNKK